MVASEVGKGSTFTLYLPRVPGDDRPQRVAAEDAPPVDGHGMSVLVVEDNIEVGTFASDALTELGYATTLVDNAMDALAELTRNAERFDVVFSDVVMPGMTGIELAQEIRRRHFDLPVVLTSGYSHVLSQNGSLRIRAAAKTVFDRAARARAAQGRPLAAGEARRGGVSCLRVNDPRARHTFRPHPEERALARVSKDGPRVPPSSFDTNDLTSS